MLLRYHHAMNMSRRDLTSLFGFEHMHPVPNPLFFEYTVGLGSPHQCNLAFSLIVAVVLAQSMKPYKLGGR